MPPHFHVLYGAPEVLVPSEELEVMEGSTPSRQLKMLIGRAALHQKKLIGNRGPAKQKHDLSAIEISDKVVFRRVYPGENKAVSWDIDPSLESRKVWITK